jgi:hypothetical protein
MRNVEEKNNSNVCENYFQFIPAIFVFSSFYVGQIEKLVLYVVNYLADFWIQKLWK